MIITVTLNPCLDKTLSIDDFQVNAVCRGNVLKTVAGGKGINVSRAVKELEGKTKALGIIGGDTGRFIIEKLRMEGINFQYIDIVEESRTCYGIIDKKNKTETVINESGPHVSEEDTAAFKKLYERTIKKDDYVTLSGSAPSSVGKGIYRELIMIAHKKKVRVLLDTSGQYLAEAIHAMPSIIKINRNELEKLFNSTLRTRDSIVKKMHFLIDKGIYLVVITQGEKDVLALSKDGGWSIRPPQISSVNSWGSGDCVVAGIAISLERNNSVAEALKLGVAAGAANTLSYGAGVIERKDVMDLAKNVIVQQL